MSNENKNKTELMAIELNNLFSKLSAKEKFVLKRLYLTAFPKRKKPRKLRLIYPLTKI
mgnify:CR=1 FL=1